MHTADSPLRFGVSVALELKRKDVHNSRSAVEWDTLRELPDGFVLRWVSPALKRAGHMWWARMIKNIPRSKTAPTLLKAPTRL